MHVSSVRVLFILNKIKAKLLQNLFFLAFSGVLILGLYFLIHNMTEQDLLKQVTNNFFETKDSKDSKDVVLQVTRFKINNNDEAVRSYLQLAQIQAEIYAFANMGLYSGMCEPSSERDSLSQGVLRYIKFFGATEVFCTNSDTYYMIEAKMPIRGNFFCIDSMGIAKEQPNTRKGSQTCE